MVKTSLSTRFPLKSCSHSGTSCNSSLRDSSASFYICFLFLLIPRDGFLRDSSFIVLLLSVAGFLVAIRESCDEDVEEAGEEEVHEVVDGSGKTNGT